MASTSTGQYVIHRVYVDVIAGELWIAEDDAGELYLPIRPTCAALELDSVPALQRIKADGRLSSGLRKIRLPSGRGEQDQQCLASTEYAWWLALIDPRRFAPERRPMLEERQRVLMHLARDVMLRRGEIRQLRAEMSRGAVESERERPGRELAPSGAVEIPIRCLQCGAPHIVTIDGAGWHLHLGVEVD